jgi:hypothetical protein
VICSCSALKSVVHKMAECHNSVHDRKATPFEAAAGFPERSPNIEGRNSWCARWPSLFINHALHMKTEYGRVVMVTEKLLSC